MAFERLPNWVRRRDSTGNSTEGPDPREPGSGSAAHDGDADGDDASSRAVWVHLLEQASDLNDELCRENCELHREVSVMRQRQLDRSRAATASTASRHALAAKVLPRVMSHVRRALRDAAPETLLPPTLENTPAAIEDAVRQTMAAAAHDADHGEAASASSEDTAALVMEKMALKELAAKQQERLLELEFLREKFSGGTHEHWASRLSSALQGTLSGGAQQPAAAAAAAADAPADAAAAAAAGGGGGSSPSTKAAPPQREQGRGSSQASAPAPILAIGDEYEVVGRRGAILRLGEDLESEQVVTLPPGSRVRILELGSSCSRRVRAEAINTPGAAPGTGPDAAPRSQDGGEDETAAPAASGWLSVATVEGKALIRPAAGVVASSALPVQASQDAQAAPDQAAAAAPVAPPDPPGEPPTAPEALASQEESSEGAAGASGADAAPVPPPAPPAATAGGHAPLVPAEASADRRSVTVSTDAWLELRAERVQRQQQIRALEGQVDVAQAELQQLAEIRLRLREQRAEALRLRMEGNEYQELAMMAEEETRGIRIEAASVQPKEGAAQREEGERTPAAEAADSGRARRKHAKHSPEAAAGKEPGSGEVCDAGVRGAGEAKQWPPKTPAAQEVAFSIDDWRRLTSERETTARELARVLQHTDELETLLEEQRVELQAAERRREKEKNSLVTTLRKLSQQSGMGDSELFRILEGDAEEAVPGRGALDTDPDSRPPATSSGSSSQAPRSREQKYIQKISALEDEERTLLAKLNALQAAELKLNRRAVERAEALKYASAVSGDADAVGAALEEGEESRRADIDGLVGILEGIFIENFSLGTGGRRGWGAGLRWATSPAAEDPAPVAPICAEVSAMDLSRFVREDGGESDESEGEDAQPRPPPSRSHCQVQSKRQAVLPTDEANEEDYDEDDPSPPFLSEALVIPNEVTSPAETPRTRLLRSLDFSSVSVAE